jgi:hypothetical protein
LPSWKPVCSESTWQLIGYSNHDRSESAIIHLKAGLKILEDIRLRRSPGSNKIHEWEREFGPILLSLGIQAASFVNPSHEVDRSELWVSLRNVATINPTNDFRSLEDARHALDAIAANITVERNEGGRRPFDLHHYDPINPKVPDGLRQINNLLAWTEGLDRFLVAFATNDPVATKRINLGASLLKLHSLIYQVVIQTPIQSVGKLQDILAHCEYLTSARSGTIYGSGELNFTPDMGLIAPLFFTILRAPDSSIRQRAVELLSRVHGREGMWDAQDALRIAADALEAAGYGDWASRSLYLTGFLPPSEQRMRHLITDRMIWPFGERWEIPISSVHTTPQLEFTAPYSASSAQTTPQTAHEPTFPLGQGTPQVKVDPAFALSASTTPQMTTDSTFPCLLQPCFSWDGYE